MNAASELGRHEQVLEVFKGIQKAGVTMLAQHYGQAMLSVSHLHGPLVSGQLSESGLKIGINIFHQELRTLPQPSAGLRKNGQGQV